MKMRAVALFGLVTLVVSFPELCVAQGADGHPLNLNLTADPGSLGALGGLNASGIPPTALNASTANETSSKRDASKATESANEGNATTRQPVPLAREDLKATATTTVSTTTATTPSTTTTTAPSTEAPPPTTSAAPVTTTAATTTTAAAVPVTTPAPASVQVATLASAPAPVTVSAPAVVPVARPAPTVLPVTTPAPAALPVTPPAPAALPVATPAPTVVALTQPVVVTVISDVASASRGASQLSAVAEVGPTPPPAPAARPFSSGDPAESAALSTVFKPRLPTAGSASTVTVLASANVQTVFALSQTPPSSKDLLPAEFVGGPTPSFKPSAADSGTLTVIPLSTPEILTVQGGKPAPASSVNDLTKATPFGSFEYFSRRADLYFSQVPTVVAAPPQSSTAPNR